MEKKRIIKSYENLSPELQEMMRNEYPYGFSNKLIRLTNSKNEPFFAVPLETEDTTYMVKVQLEKIKRKKHDDDEFHFATGDEDFDDTSSASYESDNDDMDEADEPGYREDYD